MDEDRPPAEPDAGTIEAWARYARERFESADAGITQSRSWARQLLTAVAVVIGLEVSIIVRLALDEGSSLQLLVRAGSLVLLLLALGLQFDVLRRTLRLGYRDGRLLGPERPSILGSYVAGMSDTEATRVIGAYYAFAYDHFRELGDRLAEAVAEAARRFQWTLAPVLAGVILLIVGALWRPISAGTILLADWYR